MPIGQKGTGMIRDTLKAAGLLFTLICLTAGSVSATSPHAGMMRTPDVSATQIVFRYANDLWLVDRAGGEARPLSSPAGSEAFPRFSPDGKTIAFIGNYDGNVDIYTLPVAGGIPFRVTYHPRAEGLCDWTNNGKLIFNNFGMGYHPRTRLLYTVSPDGGLPEKMPVPYGGIGSISDDGRMLAYIPYTRDSRTWKRYAGGMATDIWLYNLEDNSARRVTVWEGTDSFPMWHGNTLYYLSDGGPNHRLNIWVYNVSTGERRQVTEHADYDVKWPAMGPGPSGGGEIVYQVSSDLVLLDLATEQERTVEVNVPGDRPLTRRQAKDVSDLISNRAISSTGKRVVVEARGDIWTLPAENGSPVNLTRTDNVAERDPSWSPDGRWIAYFTDESGEYEMFIRQSDGLGEPKRLMGQGSGFLFDPVWSPDSKQIALWDKTGRLYVHHVDRGATREVAKQFSDERNPVSWSGDSNWLAYTNRDGRLTLPSIRLYNVEKDKSYQVTSGMFTDTWPTFDRDGKYLFFASNREFSEPKYEDVGRTWIYSDTDHLYVVPLQDDTPSPFAPESDEETWDDDSKKDDDEGDKDDEDEDEDEDEDDEEEEEETEPVEIDLDGFERRAVEIPIERGGFISLSVNSGGNLLYGRMALAGSDGDGEIQIFDLEEKEEDDREQTVLDGAIRFTISSDGEKLLVVKRSGFGIIDAAADQEFEAVSTSGMIAEIDPQDEWAQMFHEAWRLYRDIFYDPNMHGVDWNAVRGQYAAMLDDCASRADLSFVISEMISELNVGHSYYGGGDYEETPSVTVGMLGCDFELHNGAYRISEIFTGGDWDADSRGILGLPAVGVEEGDYILAVNGVPVDPAKAPWAAFQGVAGRTVTLTVSDDAALDDDDSRVVLELLDSEFNVRYRSWVEKNRAYVAERSGGRVGYIYVPDTGRQGQNELVRQFYGQRNRAALIIDERWNGGGQVPDRFIELLNRPSTNLWSERYRSEDEPMPVFAHQGPKCMLINGLAGSGGDMFPWLFRAAGLGKLIGTRTWGGLVGIQGVPRLIDGGGVTVPEFAFYELDGTWGVEGYGVAPDMEVLDDPSMMADGGDPQLDAAIAHMLEEIERNPYTYPERPAYPDRSGMIITEEDR